MRKFFLVTLFLLIMTNVVFAGTFFEDDEGFSYITDENYIVFSPGNKACTVYDLSSITILEDRNDYFKFSVARLTVSYNDKSVTPCGESVFSEDLETGEIYVDDTSIDDRSIGISAPGKTHREIYFKIKRVALGN